MTAAPALTPLELAIGNALGEFEGAPPLPNVAPDVRPLQAFGEAMLPALQRPPCLVAFSGGRDSSATLAIAALVARREGLPLPIPVTAQYPHLPETDESDWQEIVVRHLELPDWHRLSFEHEMDLLGPVAQRVLRRHGIRWPLTLHVLLPMLDEARGGSLLTGIDGEIIAYRRCERAAAVVSGRARPVPRDILRVGVAVAPAVLRAAWYHRRDSLELPWLWPEARDAAVRALAAEEAREPLRWDRHIARYARLRDVALNLATSDVLAADTGALLIHPFLDRRFLAALARAGGWLGLGERQRAMRALFAELLPRVTVERTTKPAAERVFWGPYSRDFVERWAGGGVPTELVDEGALRDCWLSASPEAAGMTTLLLQSAWLASVAEPDRVTTSMPPILDAQPVSDYGE